MGLVRVSEFLINKEELEELYDKHQYLENVISTKILTLSSAGAWCCYKALGD